MLMGGGSVALLAARLETLPSPQRDVRSNPSPPSCARLAGLHDLAQQAGPGTLFSEPAPYGAANSGPLSHSAG